jgi:signal peptidase I
MSGSTLAPAIGTPLPSRCVPPGTAPQVAPSLPLLSRLLRRLVRGLGNLLLLVVVVAFAGLAVGPHVFGYRTMTMLTGSMAPRINPGDVTVAVQEPTSRVAVGQVISYRIPVDDHRVVSHRVVKVTRGPGSSVSVQTKGDANKAADPWTAIIADPHVWTVRAVVPYLGDVIRTLRGPGLHIVFLYVGPALLTLLLLVEIWRTPKARAGGAPDRGYDKAVLDTEVLVELADDLGDPSRLRTFLDLWSSMLDGRMSTLREALEAGDLATAYDRVLSLRSSSSMIGLTALAATAEVLEQHVHDGDAAMARAALRAVDAQLEPARTAVAAYAAGLV